MTDLITDEIVEVVRKIARDALRIAYQRNVRLSFGPGQHVMTPSHFMEGAIEEAITAALPMLVRAEWRPIETAPKDGTVIGVRGGCAYWNADKSQWFTITGQLWPGRAIRWDVTEWKDLRPTAIRSRGEP